MIDGVVKMVRREKNYENTGLVAALRAIAAFDVRTAIFSSTKESNARCHFMSRCAKLPYLNWGVDLGFLVRIRVFSATSC